ncbi:putative peptidoglycan binding protein [Pantoea allii]|uniref:Putative peptidoglycan binding protein n=1 Tax=Pantoea allii TaxID=574096 RepID=A0A2V2BG47_9GAMM|nr:peptidoglycan-binding protein [Pantoea allii]PWK96686.1 putative peptidoglycan binding protein [Pantoea allii]
MSITGSVGAGGRNNYGDVKTVQQLLQRNGFPQLRDDGRMGPKTIDAIKSYQSKFMSRPDGLIDIHGRTWNRLSDSSGTNTTQPAYSAEDNRHLNSGRLTVNAGQVTFDAEGNDWPNSPSFSRHIHWPKGASGVTIGRGYDMGGRSSETVKIDLIQAGVPIDQAILLARGAQLSPSESDKFVKKHRDECGVITREAQAKLFEMIYPKYLTRGESIYLAKTSGFPERTAWNNLKSPIKDIAVDFVYQGLGFERTMKACMYNDIDKLIYFIENNAQVKSYEGGRQRANYLRKHK